MSITLIIGTLIFCLACVVITAKLIFPKKRSEVNEIKIPPYKKLQCLLLLLIPYIVIGCMSTSGTISELAKLKDDYAKKQAEAEKNLQEYQNVNKTAEQLKSQVLKLNEDYKKIDEERKVVATQLSAITKLNNAGDLLNVFVYPTLKFAVSLIKNIVSKWFWAIFWYAIFIAIATEVLGLWLLGWSKTIISIIPMIPVFFLTLVIQKADMYCGAGLAILSWLASHEGWALFINTFKAHKPVLGVANKVLSPNIMSILNKFGEKRVKKVLVKTEGE